MKVVSLFCGCGGLDLGFEKAGFNITSAFDNWEPAVNTYKANFSHPIFLKDLSDSDTLSLILKNEPDIIIGGPPCQDFSQAGHRNEDGGRASLSITFADLVINSRVNIFVMENVPEVYKSKTFVEVERKFVSAGFGLTKIVLDANFYNCPQIRKRAFTIGIKGEQTNFLSALLLAGKAKHRMTVYDYLGDLFGIDYYFRVPRSYKRRGVFSIYEPSPTVRGVDRPIPSGYKTLPNDPAPVEKARVLTPKERSLIQTFPYDFTFIGSKSEQNQMIGNAVPVNLAFYVASCLRLYLEKLNE